MQRRINRLFPLFFLAIAAFAVTAFGLSATAQEATPPSGPITANEVAPGVTAEVFAAAPSLVAPGQTVYSVRFIFQPGAEIFPHGHPGTTVLGVQSGEFGWTLVQGVAHVIRGAGSGATGPVEEITVPGTEVILEPGDSIYYESDVIHTARGAGDEPAVVAGSLVLEAGAPLLMPAGMDMSDMGTPAQ
jgi:quercetin dioxygenase-like cupin family protein